MDSVLIPALRELREDMQATNKSVKELREEFEAIVTTAKQTRDRVDSVQADAREDRRTVMDLRNKLERLTEKMTDIEDRGRRNNVRLVGQPEGAEGTNVAGFLRVNLSKWIPSLRGRDIEIDRAHRVYDGGRGSDRLRTETIKCAIRGFFISFSSTLAKAKTHQFTQLENKIQSLQNLQKQHFTEQQATQLSSLKEEYDLLSHSKAEFILHRTRQKYYFESERPSHLLALRLKECESKAYISAIKSSDDQVTTNPVAINDIFKGFYTNLYKAETDFDEPICKQYLDKLELPRISQIYKESLEAPLSLEELHSLKSLQKGKSPGLDGLPLNYI